VVKRLSGLDAYLLYSETAQVPTHTIKIAVVDTSGSGGQFTFDRFRRVVQRRLPELAPLRYRLVDIPLKLHHPMWLENCEVDLDFHLRQVTVPRPGGRREFDDLVAQIAQDPLDRSRPLWEMHFVEGLADQKLAVIVKVHHALADGVASANLLAQAIYAAGTPDQADATTCKPPVSTELLRAAGRDHLKHLKQLPSVIKDTAAGTARVRRRARERRKHAELARLFAAPKTFINHRVSPGRRFATATLSLAQAKETSKKLGVSLNDLVLAISAGALRELVLRHDGKADEPMIASVPVSSDPSAKRISGNAFGNLLVSLPVQIDAPLERVQLVTLATSIAKENNALRGPELMGRWFEYVPPPLAPPAFQWFGHRDVHNKMYNVSISNVPGPRERGRIAEVPISEFYSVGPLTQACGMNITVWSYVDQLNIGVLTDDRTLDDAHEFTDSMICEFAELRRAAGLPQQLAQIETAMPQAVSRSEIHAATRIRTK
jgi:diacylglycerol O-acyltransferase / wax synthase